MTLFDADAEPDQSLASKEQVRALVFYGHREDIVRGWTRERAELVIRNRKARDRADAARAMSAAGLMDDVPRSGASVPERLVAAEAVEQSLGGPPLELLAVLMGSLYVLTDDELRAVAVDLVARYRRAAAVAAVV